MKLRHLLFDDFWRKLVALIFAVVIYWQVGESVKKNGSSSRSESGRHVKCEHVKRDFSVRMLDSGIAGRRVLFEGDSAPKIRATLCGAKKKVKAVQDDDLVFYVDAGEFASGKSASLPVRWHIRRPGVVIVKVFPAEVKVFAIEDTEKTIK